MNTYNRYKKTSHNWNGTMIKKFKKYYLFKIYIFLR